MKRIMRPLAFSFGVSTVLAAVIPQEASAQEASSFGDKGELIITADRLMPLFSYSSQTVTTTPAGQEVKVTDSGTSLALLLGREPALTINPHSIPRIAIDYSVIDHLTLGGSFVLAFGLGGSHTTEAGNNTQKNDAPKATVVGFAPRVGYVLPITETFGFWPRAGIAFYSVSWKEEDIRGGNTVTTTTKDSSWSIDLDPQFVWVPLQHFFVHFGPLLNIPFAGSRSTEVVQGGTSSTTSNDLSVFHFGLSAGLGGWFDL
jgi:hypothetical protein